MFDVIKKPIRLNAYRLGEQHPVIDRLISEGKLTPLEDGTFEIVTRESDAGVSGKGEIARKGDYIKFDAGGFPYPNGAEFFQQSHRRLGENEYEQISKPLKAWDVREPMCEEIQFLIEHKGLVISEADEQRYFTAPLWGTVESAAKDSVIIFYSIERDESGKIADASFNFVVRCEFDKTYEII